MLRIIEVLRSFVSDETGFVKQENSLALSWTASVLIAAAVLLGPPAESGAGTSGQPHAACPGQALCMDYCTSAGAGHRTGFCPYPHVTCNCFY